MTTGAPTTLELRDQHDRRIVRLALKTAWPSAPSYERRRIDEMLEQLKTK